MTTTAASLADRIEGAVITPDDPTYEAARQGWNLLFSHRPAVIVDAASIDDVVTAVRYATQAGAKLAVQATGHGFATTTEGVVLVLTRNLDSIMVDAEGRTATVGAGLTWGPVLEATQAVGLAPLLGSSPDVGAVAYTLGGGFGWLGRRYGLAVDHVLSFTVVLADGSVVEASERSNPDLFWALRGGGPGSLGVVVDMTVELFPVTEVYGGNLLYPLEDAREVFDFYTRWSPGLPDEMTTSFVIMNFPPMDIVPAPLRGKSFAIVRGCHSGDLDEAAALVDQIRAWREPAIDMFAPMPFSQSATISSDPADPLPALSSARWLNGIDGDVLDAILEITSQPSPVLFAEIRHVGGAVARHQAGAAYSSRQADRLLQVVGVAFEPEVEAELSARQANLWRRLAPKLAPGGYLNFLEGEERRIAAAEAFDPATRARLATIKRTVDPDDLFGVGLDLTS